MSCLLWNGSTARFRNFPSIRTQCGRPFITLTAKRMKRCGVPSHIWCAADSRQLSLCSWNARALLHQDVEARQRKKHVLVGLVKSTQFLLVQEVHGDMEAARHFLATFRKTHRCFCDFNESHAAGGLVTMVPIKFDANKLQEPSTTSFSDGRILRVAYVVQQGRVIIWNLHIYDIGAEEISSALTQLKFDLADAKANPSGVL
eukprot:10659472-Karenia_brevis.AAC.1